MVRSPNWQTPRLPAASLSKELVADSAGFLRAPNDSFTTPQTREGIFNVFSNPDNCPYLGEITRCRGPMGMVQRLKRMEDPLDGINLTRLAMSGEVSTQPLLAGAFVPCNRQKTWEDDYSFHSIVPYRCVCGMDPEKIRHFKLSPYAKCWAALKRTPDRGVQIKISYKIIKAAKKKAEKIIADAEKKAREIIASKRRKAAAAMEAKKNNKKQRQKTATVDKEIAML